MNLRKHLVIAIAATALLAGTALPASAAPGDTTTTFTINAGSLTLSVQAGAALTNAATGTTSITGNLGAVSVTDLRGGAGAWNVSAASTAFIGVLFGSSSTAVLYTGGTVTETGTITVADGAAVGLTTAAAPVISPTALSGNNSAAWNPALAVTMPAGARADDYSGTVTTSVL